jgi:hypothetical protein
MDDDEKEIFSGVYWEHYALINRQELLKNFFFGFYSLNCFCLLLNRDWFFFFFLLDCLCLRFVPFLSSYFTFRARSFFYGRERNAKMLGLC